MKLEKVEQWSDQGKEIALATVIRTWGSSPRPVGSRMAITSQGEITGSVSGGCVESAVLEVGHQVIKDGLPQKTHFGIADETAWDVGLACGGELDVFVKPFEKKDVVLWKKAEEIEGGFCRVMIVNGPQSMLGRETLITAKGERVGPDLEIGGDNEIRTLASAAIQKKESDLVEVSQPDQNQTMQIFLHVRLPRPTLVAVGGVHIAIPLMKMAKALNYHTVVIDPRKLFATPDRFPDVDLLMTSWPREAFDTFEVDEYTAIAMLTHDPKIDDPALQIALTSDAFYVGALGSQKTQADRRQRLLASGLREENLNRLHAPIGLDLGGRDPEEIAIAVMAEIVKVLNV